MFRLIGQRELTGRNFPREAHRQGIAERMLAAPLAYTEDIPWPFLSNPALPWDRVGDVFYPLRLGERIYAVSKATRPYQFQVLNPHGEVLESLPLAQTSVDGENYFYNDQVYLCGGRVSTGYQILLYDLRAQTARRIDLFLPYDDLCIHQLRVQANQLYLGCYRPPPKRGFAGEQRDPGVLIYDLNTLKLIRHYRLGEKGAPYNLFIMGDRIFCLVNDVSYKYGCSLHLIHQRSESIQRLPGPIQIDSLTANRMQLKFEDGILFLLIPKVQQLFEAICSPWTLRIYQRQGMDIQYRDRAFPSLLKGQFAFSDETIVCDDPYLLELQDNAENCVNQVQSRP